MIIETLTRFYGIDWMASLFAVLMIYNIGNKKRIGFFFGVAANLSWLAFAILASSPPIFLSNIVFFGLNLRGIIKWRSTVTPQAPRTEASSCKLAA